jgi:hypothetical protein
MKYLFLVLFLFGCSNGLTTKEANDCAELAATVKFDHTISDTNKCVLKQKVYGIEYTYYIPIDQIEGALRVVDLQRDMARAPLMKACMDKCEGEAPKQVCPGDKSLHAQNCGGYCEDAVHLDETEMKIKPHRGPQKRPSYGPKPPPPIGPRPGSQ